MENRVHDWYKVETYLLAYENILSPINGPDLWPQTTLPPLNEPYVEPQVGRPKTNKNKKNDDKKETRETNQDEGGNALQWLWWSRSHNLRSKGEGI